MTSRSRQDEIAELDRQILRSLAKRQELLAQWQRDKDFPSLLEHQRQSVERGAASGTSVQQRQDEESLIRWIAGTTYQRLEPHTRVAYLGPIYSYSYLAALEHFGDTPALQAVSSIGAVFDEVARGQAQWGVVPIENSTDGRIVDSLTMFAKAPARICGEILLPIHHYLLGLGQRSQVQVIYSKPQALSQCRNWLHEHVPEAKWIEVSSTATAASMAAQDAKAAAIASREAGIHHGLQVIDPCIEDNTHNTTRFVILGNQLPAVTGKDKTSLMFRVPHQPGALADAMQLFRQANLNLTWIESFPIPGCPNEYLFFIELEGHQAQEAVAITIRALRQQCVRLEVLGSYPRAAPKPASNGAKLAGNEFR
jgi:chorismate mutase/prephenate dehydratase